MNPFIGIIEIGVLFWLLGNAADFVILNIRKLGESLRLQVFFLGLLLGFFTSLPELAIGVSALTSGAPAISLGNLLGGVVVIFGLVLGISLILNRVVKTDGNALTIVPIFVFLLAPVLFASNGQLTSLEGVVLLLGYLCLLYFLYRRHRVPEDSVRATISPKEILQQLFSVVIGAILLLIISHYIIALTLSLLDGLPVSRFVIGLLVFSIGTNLPEIIVAFRSWKRHIKDLSLSNLLGSAMANVMLIGAFSVVEPLSLNIGMSYTMLTILLIALLSIIGVAYVSGKRLTRKEGFILTGIYGVFVLSQLFILF